MIPECDWAIANAATGRFECRRCGSSEEMPMGLLIVQFADICAGFVRRHLACPPAPTPVIVRAP